MINYNNIMYILSLLEDYKIVAIIIIYIYIYIYIYNCVCV